MGRAVAAIALGIAMLWAGHAFGWGAQGHEQVGYVAEPLLNDHARTELKRILADFGDTAASGRPDLARAAVWADCARDVKRSASTHEFHLVVGPRSPTVCHGFAGTPEADRMVAYASRNWDQCDYFSGCYNAFHFADVAIQNDAYDASLVGTSDHDVVHAIRAAMLVLQGQPCPAPFHIESEREAALLLAHFVGDLHQPLHVGAVYLTDGGALRDPGASPEDAVDTASATRGGNALMFGRSSNLHSTWDGVPAAWGNGVQASLLTRARRVDETAGPLLDRPAIWASETVGQAQQAFRGLTFSPVQGHGTGRHWIAQFNNQTTYGAARRRMQAEQVARAGARLAEVYNAIWP